MREDKSRKDETYEAEREPDAPAPFELAPKKIALAAVDWTVPQETGPRARTCEDGFDPFFADVAQAAESADCDTVVYALWSHDLRKTNPLDEARVFGSTTKVQTAILEVFDDEDSRIEVWRRGAPPHRFRQRFTRSTSPTSSKQAFMDGLPARRFGSTLMMACGEANIVSTRRDSDEIVDPFGFTDWLQQTRPRLILNPSHSYMRRYEMTTKRALYSEGRTLLTVWNRGEKPPEPGLPWRAFVDSEDRTSEIHEIELAKTGEIRVGVFELR
ncbi:MAG TPA: hypothetical protein VNO30_22770 [Kofleriaceae bacterium]|nr:hypothetical protein [Kofleriaceae bacterium]